MELSIPRAPRGSRRPIVIAIYVVLIGLAYLLAFQLRFDFTVPADEWRRAVVTLPVLLLLQLGALTAFRVHAGSWRHAGVHDLLALTAAAGAGAAAFAMALLALGFLPGIPRSVLLLNTLLFVLLAGGARLGVRCVHEGRFARRSPRERRTLVIGAGEAAERFLRESTHAGRREVHVVGCLDDNRRIQGLSIHGVPVLGPIDRVGEIAARQRAELLIIAIPSASGEQMRHIVGLCERAGVQFKVLPSRRELLEGRAEIGQLRDIELEDLLGRAPVHLDLRRVQRDLAGETILVTGAAGSIGSELARQIAGLRPARLILFEQAETPLYFLDLELAKSHPALEVIAAVGDITDAERLDEIFRRYAPAYVFHAAAYKHVPMMESNPAEAVRNNVLGTLQTAECAARHGVRKFVLISTDKAVNPSSVMGTTKRLAELVVLGWPSLVGSGTDFRAVRFGNVLGSDGSVIPLFRRQLATGGPLTVTHRDVRRYFMTIPEAVALVLQAAALPEASCRIAMLDMGEPVRILDLAEQLVKLSGLTPYRDIDIVFTGLRPGEKLDEELTSLLEASTPTEAEKIRVVQTGGVAGSVLQHGVTRILAAAGSGSRAGLLRELHAVVPEFLAGAGDREVPVASNGRRQPPLAGSVAGDGVAAGRTAFEIGRRLAADDPEYDAART